MMELMPMHASTTPQAAIWFPLLRRGRGHEVVDEGGNGYDGGLRTRRRRRPQVGTGPGRGRDPGHVEQW